LSALERLFRLYGQTIDVHACSCTRALTACHRNLGTVNVASNHPSATPPAYGPTMSDLFSDVVDNDAPLAERMRPRNIDEVVGQRALLAPGRLLRRFIETDQIPSMILVGPPGTGKTTLARLVATKTERRFETLSAVLDGVGDLRKIIARARDEKRIRQARTILFVDEIHRWSKSQQDALLDAVERGVITLIGATTENPSFALNRALLSRCRIFDLELLTKDEISGLLRRAISDPKRGLGPAPVELEDEAIEWLAETAEGDARRALHALEMVVRDACAESSGPARIGREDLEARLDRRVLEYDRAGAAHYGLASAFIKSLRGSDPDAATYYLVRMLESGEDPRFLIRRMVIFASEDIGNADPNALSITVSTLHAYELVGLPEGVLPLTQAATYLALAPKSNAVLTAYGRARKDVLDVGSLPVPSKLLNASDHHSRSRGHGQGYRYPHDFGGIAPGEHYLPDRLRGRRYYTPSSNGAEAGLRERLDAQLEARDGTRETVRESESESESERGLSCE